MSKSNERVAAEVVSRSLHMRTLHEATREVDFVASTDSIDSYGEIVEQSWRLDRYRNNPVVLFGHDSRSLPIGFASQVSVTGTGLEARIRFVSEQANPEAERVWQSVKEGSLRAVSVGFYPHTVRIERRNDEEVLVLSDNELFEISVVPIPANPDALAKMRARAFTSVTASVPGATEENMGKNAKAVPDTASVAGAVLSPEVEAVILESKAAEPQPQISSILTELEALRGQNLAIVAERDAALKRAREAEDKLVELEVGALVGVKIQPHEKGVFVKLASANRSLFDEMIAQRGELPALKSVIADEEKRERSGERAVFDGDFDLFAVAAKSA